MLTTQYDYQLRTLLGIIVVILILAGMYASRSVTMPLGMALFVMILAWPLQRRLETRLPQGISLGITITVILFIMGLFLGILMICADLIANQAPKYVRRFGELYQAAAEWAERRGLAFQFELIDMERVAERILDILGGFVIGVYGFMGPLVLIAAYVILGLLEVHTFHEKLEKRINTPSAHRLLHAARDTANSIRSFMLTKTLTSGITGVLVGLYTWAIGLDFPLVWGVTSFLLNYIPVLGSIIAVIPPTLIALLQPDAPAWLVVATFGGLSVIQLSMGNYVDPWLQGKFLFLSPLVLFFSIPFWGWIWGIPGALLGVPLTVSIVIGCRHFESTHWIAELLGSKKIEEEQV